MRFTVCALACIGALCAASSSVFGQSTTRASVGTGGVQANLESYYAALSVDGRFVAFYSDAANLVAGDANATGDVFVHDRRTGITRRVSVDSAGVEGDDESDQPAISAAGRFVAYASEASNLVAADTNGAGDIFVHDLRT